MDIYSRPGTKVVYLGENGYDSQRETANKILKVGQAYIVKNIDVGDSYSYVALEEVPNQTFNTVMFDNIRLV